MYIVAAAVAAATVASAAVAAGALFKHKHASTVKSSQRKVVTQSMWQQQQVCYRTRADHSPCIPCHSEFTLSLLTEFNFELIISKK